MGFDLAEKRLANLMKLAEAQIELAMECSGLNGMSTSHLSLKGKYLSRKVYTFPVQHSTAALF